MPRGPSESPIRSPRPLVRAAPRIRLALGPNAANRPMCGSGVAELHHTARRRFRLSSVDNRGMGSLIESRRRLSLLGVVVQNMLAGVTVRSTSAENTRPRPISNDVCRQSDMSALGARSRRSAIHRRRRGAASHAVWPAQAARIASLALLFVVAAGCSGGPATSDAGDPYAQLRNHVNCPFGFSTDYHDQEAGVSLCSFNAPFGRQCFRENLTTGTCTSLRDLSPEVARYVSTRMVFSPCLQPSERLPACVPSDGSLVCPGEFTCVGAQDTSGRGGVCVPLPCNR